MSKRSTRREFLRRSASLAAGLSVLRAAKSPAAPVAAATKTPLAQFRYGDVQLLEGPMLVQFQHNHELFLNLDENSILKPFRQLAGLPAPGEDLGGWYSPSPLFDPPKNMTGYIPGYSFGQWLSALSRAYAVTGDKRTQAKVQRLVSGFAPTITEKFLPGLLHSGLHLRQDELWADRRLRVWWRSIGAQGSRSRDRCCSAVPAAEGAQPPGDGGQAAQECRVDLG